MFFYNPWVRKWGLLLPPPTGRSPSLEEGGLGASRSLSKFLIQLRVQGRNPARFKGGYGVPRGFKGEKSKSPPNPLGLAERVYSFHRLRAVPLPRRGRSLGWKIERRQNVGGRAMRAPTTLRKIATVRCICNAGLHHCNGQMYLQPSVAPPSPVGARIARPFIPDVIITLRAGARRVIGATAKPLYAIDDKAGRP